MIKMKSTQMSSFRSLFLKNNAFINLKKVILAIIPNRIFIIIIEKIKFFFQYSLFDKNLRNVEYIIKYWQKKSNRTNYSYDINFIKRFKQSYRSFQYKFWEQHFELNFFLKSNYLSGRILDFGCGTGQMDIIIARNGYFIDGIDLSSVAISVARYFQSLELIEIQKRLNFFLKDISKFNPKYLYDSIWASHVFEHIEDPKNIFNYLKKICKKNACILISVPLGYAFDDPDHIHHFMTKNDLKNHLSKHIKVNRVECFKKDQVLRAFCTFN